MYTEGTDNIVSFPLSITPFARRSAAFAREKNVYKINRGQQRSSGERNACASR